MRYTHLRTYVLAALVLTTAAGQSTGAQTSPGTGAQLPPAVRVSDVEIRLDRNTGGGCPGRCVRYRVTLGGDGTLIYQDLADPPVPSRQRVISGADVVRMLNEFVRAGFFDSTERFMGTSFYIRQGEQFLLRGQAGADGPEWDLFVRMGPLKKSVHLYLGYPEQLARLRDRLDELGGPRAWGSK